VDRFKKQVDFRLAESERPRRTPETSRTSGTSRSHSSTHATRDREHLSRPPSRPFDRPIPSRQDKGVPPRSFRTPASCSSQTDAPKQATDCARSSARGQTKPENQSEHVSNLRFQTHTDSASAGATTPSSA
jgi:hypothetical protein